MLEDADHLRWQDHSLDDDEAAVSELFTSFYDGECPIERVHAAEPGGFARTVWDQLVAIGAVAMAVPEDRGGGGAGLVAAVLAGEPHGRRLAPVPLAETMAAARLLARHDAGAEWLDAVVGGGAIVPLAVCPTAPGDPPFVHGAPVADAVVGLDGDELVVVAPAVAVHVLPNLGRLSLGRVPLAAGARTVLAQGDDALRSYAVGRREWQLVTASALIGIAAEALAIGAAHARERRQFGVPIGTFQAVAHPLAEVSISVEAGRRLVHRAAWYADHEDDLRWVVPAFVHAAETAARACQVAMHVLGGVGVTESVLTDHLRRAKAWPLVGGDPDLELLALADDLFGPVGQPRAGTVPPTRQPLLSAAGADGGGAP